MITRHQYMVSRRMTAVEFDTTPIGSVFDGLTAQARALAGTDFDLNDRPYRMHFEKEAVYNPEHFDVEAVIVHGVLTVDLAGSREVAIRSADKGHS